MKSLLPVALVLSLSALAASPPQGPPGDTEERAPVPGHLRRAEAMRSAALAWLDSLSPDLRAKAQQPFEGEARTTWGYVRPQDVGVALAELDPARRALLDQLLLTGLSEKGFQKAQAVLTLEEVLGRDPGTYRTVVFGHPDAEAPWAWRFEGHHVSLNFTVQDGKFVASTPLFLGADPAVVAEGEHAGLAPFAEEEKRARDIVGGFEKLVAKYALREGPPPDDILLGPDRAEVFEKAEGVSIGRLTPALQFNLMRLLGIFTGSLHGDLGLPILDRYRYLALDDIGFLWIGGTEPGEPFYFRYSSVKKEFAFEYLNRGNHVHCVLRDAAEDFGARQIDAWR